MPHSTNFKDITGQKFGRITAIRYVGKNEDKRALWECNCDCGNTVIVDGKSLRLGNTKSCGCYNLDRIAERNKIIHKTHGETNTKLFHIWGGIKSRCKNPNMNNYHDYGGKGVSICEEWDNSFEAFRDWSYENGYKDGLTIDRIDSNGNYCPENCRWATVKEQNRNRKSNKLITYNGETHCIADWADILGINYDVLQHRISVAKMPIKKAFEMPYLGRGKFDRKKKYD